MIAKYLNESIIRPRTNVKELQDILDKTNIKTLAHYDEREQLKHSDGSPSFWFMKETDTSARIPRKILCYTYSLPLDSGTANFVRMVEFLGEDRVTILYERSFKKHYGLMTPNFKMLQKKYIGNLKRLMLRLAAAGSVDAMTGIIYKAWEKCTRSDEW